MRKMTLDDLPFVYEIELECFSDPWLYLEFLESFNNNECLVFLDNGIIIGYFIGLPVLDEYNICNLAIKPSYQGKGYGKQFLSSIIFSHNSRYKKYFLEVRSTNIPAIKLYKYFGFREIYTRKNYYQDPTEDAIVMALSTP